MNSVYYGDDHFQLNAPPFTCNVLLLHKHEISYPNTVLEMVCHRKYVSVDQL